MREADGFRFSWGFFGWERVLLHWFRNRFGFLNSGPGRKDARFRSRKEKRSESGGRKTESRPMETGSGNEERE